MRTMIQARVECKGWVCRQFFGWITGLENIVKIEVSERVVEQYRDYLGEIIERYLLVIGEQKET